MNEVGITSAGAYLGFGPEGMVLRPHKTSDARVPLDRTALPMGVGCSLARVGVLFFFFAMRITGQTESYWNTIPRYRKTPNSLPS